MRTRRALSIAAGAAALALASLAIASPASAATLPSGQKITIVDLILADVGPTGSQMYNVNPANAASTSVGSVQAPDNIQAIDVADTGLGYATGHYTEDPQNPAQEQDWVPVLLVADANTGTYGTVVDIAPVDDEITINQCTGLDLQPNGEIIVACLDLSDGLLDSYIGVVTPLGAFTPFISSGENDVEEYYYTALAYNAVTSELWAFADFDGTGAAFLLDRAAGTQGPPVVLDERVTAADFDRDGQLFVSAELFFEGDPGQFVSALATANTATGALTIVDPFNVGTNDLYPVWALTVWGAPGLAATGATGTDMLPIGLGSALLLLAGAAFIATARMNRRAAA